VSIWTWLDGGMSMPEKRTWGQRLALWFGRRLATRHRHVRAHPTCRLSPQAHIHPRRGAISLGSHTTVALGAIVQGNVSLGDHTSVQAYSVLVGYGGREDPTGQIRIGSHVRIAPQVMMIAANHVFADPERPIHGQGLEHAPIVVQDDVWIGGRVNVIAGVTIGRGSVIGAGAVVTRDIPPYSTAMGVPARVIGTRKKVPGGGI
jgi:acetyltransferase-like isoleucine patch superfamily enzyme